jgi:hypothetical protein
LAGSSGPNENSNANHATQPTIHVVVQWMSFFVGPKGIASRMRCFHLQRTLVHRGTNKGWMDRWLALASGIGMIVLRGIFLAINDPQKDPSMDVRQMYISSGT